MKSFKSIKYKSEKFQNFAIQFLHSSDRKQEIIQRSIFSILLSYIFSLINKTPFPIIPINGGARTAKQFIKHLFWYFLWTIKWKFFNSSRNNKIITSSFFPEIKSSQKYIQALYTIAEKENITIINFGMIYYWRLLLRKNIYCYPFFFYKLFSSKISIREITKYNNIVTNQLFKHFNYYIVNYLDKDILRLLEFYSVIEKFVKKIRLTTKIYFYISDNDNLDSRVIVCELHKMNDIQTILVDHSLNTFSQINNQLYFDKYLCWSDYHKEAYDSNLHEYESISKLKVVGNPVANFQIKISPTGKKWIYFLPSFQHQTSLTIYRNYNRTKSFIAGIEKLIKHEFLNNKLLVKCHPADSPRINELLEVEKIEGEIESILKNCELVFLEDTTLVAELLKYNVKIIYIANKKGADLFNIEKYRCGRIVKEISELRDKVIESLHSTIDYNDRRLLYHYLLGSPDLDLTRFKIHLSNYTI